MLLRLRSDPTADVKSPEALILALRPLIERFPTDGITEDDLLRSMKIPKNWQNCYKHHWNSVRRPELTNAMQKALFSSVDRCYRDYFHQWLGHSRDVYSCDIPGGLAQPHAPLQELADQLFGSILEGTNHEFCDYASTVEFRQCGLRNHLHRICLSEAGEYDAAKGALSPYIFMEHVFANGGGK